MVLGEYTDLRVDRYDRVFVITMQKAPENRLNVRFTQEIIRALRDIEQELGPDSEGCVQRCSTTLLTGHTFGGACPFALAHDYRIMNFSRGFFSMPPVDLGLHFPGIGYLPRLKLHPQIARKMLLEAHRWTGKTAYEDGIVDEVANPEEMLAVALKKASEIQGKAKMGVYSLLRNELWGEAAEKIRGICYVHGRIVTAPARAKI
ncbi:ClpP/crotonase [Cucurbitaria berberidis CBS 394.84]|uniref:ClpP/crotonase n=1 Tax=Cucurbitaria berberidis CBS 394.84 TaxID=1168544 RepID=A0A9P4GR06_9PLEO|nr:ClpP/crotonase [Cucurbitaria berberidis CBS 394.84]KAF1849747.1 ClpP/crotonase [Cucurbitaria berberidis CBS 394.84]